MYRLFISVNLSPELLGALRTTQDQLKRKLADYPLRWTRPEGIHLTLKFLGDTEPARVDAIAQALQEAVEAHRPFTVSMGGLGCFPNPSKTSVLWVGIQDPEKRLQKLAADVDKAAVSLGWERERRPFTGHLTLARVQRYAKGNERRALGESLPTLGVEETMGDVQVRHIHLMRSQLDPQGAIYTSLVELALGQAMVQP